jgi:hypothetical protein
MPIILLWRWPFWWFFQAAMVVHSLGATGSSG